MYVAPPHPSSCYQPGKQSNMETKLSRSDIFSTSVRRALDPSASPSEFGKEFWSTNSFVFRFLQLAALEGSSHGGQRSWERRKAAVERYEAGMEPLDDDEKRVQHFLDFMQQSWDVETIYIAAAQILLMNPEADRSEIRRQIVESCPDVSEGALKIQLYLYLAQSLFNHSRKKNNDGPKYHSTLLEECRG